MENWTLHWLEASGTLTPWSETIEKEIASAYTNVCKFFEAPRVDILLRRSGFVIPEIGMVGRAYSQALCSIDFDPDNAQFLACHSNGTLQRQVAHEIHHCMRMRRPGYGKKLEEVLVSEGLAGHFSRVLFQNPPEPWESALPLDAAFKYMPEPEALQSISYDHNEWFFGKDGRYPRWLGYTLGYGIVAQWMEKAGPDAVSQMVDVNTETVLASIVDA